MKYVYVLVSSYEDYYYEQCYISIKSLMYYNPNAKIVIVTDNKTNDTLVGFRRLIMEDVSELIVETYDEGISAKIRSRFLKTSLRKFVNGDFLYIDLDTVIADDLSSIIDQKYDLAMVLDQHVPISQHYMKKHFFDRAKKVNYTAGYNDMHFNSGVMYVKDNEKTHKFFELWHQLYLETMQKELYLDQLSLNQANYLMKGVISQLDGEWNVQINSGLKYIGNAKVIHYLGYQPFDSNNIYYNTLPFELCDSKIFEEIKRTQSLTAKVREIIAQPKSAFKTVTIIPSDCLTYDLIWSNHMRILKFMYVKIRFLYNFFEKIYGKLFYMIFKRT